MKHMQQQLEDIEMKLWEYLDGSCSESAKQDIVRAIAVDDVWRAKYAELKLLHEQLATMEAHQPSMRFTANVMDNIKGVPVATTATQYLNNWVVKGIAAFFLLIITGLSVYAIATADWSVSSSRPDYVSLERMMDGRVLNTLAFIAIVLVLVFIDRMVRFRHAGEKEL